MGEAHLRRILKIYAAYYNEIRPHMVLDKGVPNCRRSLTVGAVAAMSILAVSIINTLVLCSDQRQERS